MCPPLAARRALTWRGMLSTRVRTLPGQTAASAWRTELFSSAMVGGGHPCLGSRLTFDPKLTELGSCLDSRLASPWPQHPVVRKRLPCHVLYRWGIVLEEHKVTSKHPRRRWQHLIPQNLDIPMPVHGSIHHDQLTPPPMVDCTPYHDWRATISIIRLDAGINQPLPLPTAHPDPTVTVVLGEPGLITEDSVSIVWGPTLCAPRPLMAASPVLESEPRTFGCTPRSISGGQNPSPNGSNWHPPPKSVDHLHSQTRSRDEAVRSDHSEQLTVFPWCGEFHRTSTLPLIWSASLSVALQNFAYVSLRHPQHPGYFWNWIYDQKQ